MNSSQNIFNKMSIFRKWKFQSRHKKLTEEWALATSMKDLAETNDEQQNDDNENNEQYDDNITKKFTLKYLGKTSIDTEKSKNATAEAIKSVITNSKSMRTNNIMKMNNNNNNNNNNNGKNKKSQRVNLIVCPKGIEMRDLQNDDILLRISIYKISYCSADATHSHVFAFIGSEDDKNTGEEKLYCYVYLCPKRRIAHEVTLSVAKCFENAYQNWRNSIEQKIYDPNENHSSINSNKKKLSLIGSSASSSIDEDKSIIASTSSKDSSTDNLLIDLSPSEEVDNNISTTTITPATTSTTTNIMNVCQKDRRNYLQNTWVSFDDEQCETRQPFFQDNSSSWDAQLVF